MSHDHHDDFQAREGSFTSPGRQTLLAPAKPQYSEDFFMMLMKSSSSIRPSPSLQAV